MYLVLVQLSKTSTVSFSVTKPELYIIGSKPLCISFSFAEVYRRMVSPNAKVVSNPIIKKEEEMNRYFALDPVDADPFLFWRAQRTEFPSLSVMALKYLSAPSSSVYSERAFSELGNIYGERRTSLTPAHSEMLLFLHHNLRQLDALK